MFGAKYLLLCLTLSIFITNVRYFDWVPMSVIKHVLKEEYDRLLELADNYENKIQDLPKGSISKKARDNNIYLYRAYRDSEKVRFIYIGKEGSEQAKKAVSDRNELIKYRKLLKKVKSEIKEIKRILNGYK